MVEWSGAFSYGVYRRWRLFVPSALPPGDVPLVVMLHGCLQTAESFARATQMDTLAAQAGFAVLYPEQSRLANGGRCWNWFSVAEQTRLGGELGFIRAAIAAAKARLPVGKVFVAGLSAGAAMGVVMASCFPEEVAAVGVHSGVAFKAATSAWTAPGIMATGPVYSAEASAAGAALCAGARAEVSAIVIHGAEDETVHPLHGETVVDQLRAMAGSDAAPSASTTNIGDRLVHLRRFELPAGGRVDALLVYGLGHAWSGGADGEAYSDPMGPVASELFLSFFGAR